MDAGCGDRRTIRNMSSASPSDFDSDIDSDAQYLSRFLISSSNMRSSPLALNSLRLAASSSRKGSQLLQRGLPRLRNTIAISTESQPIFTQSRTMVTATQTSEKPHNAWLGSKGPAAFDLRSKSMPLLVKPWRM